MFSILYYAYMYDKYRQSNSQIFMKSHNSFGYAYVAEFKGAKLGRGKRVGVTLHLVAISEVCFVPKADVQCLNLNSTALWHPINKSVRPHTRELQSNGIRYRL